MMERLKIGLLTDNYPVLGGAGGIGTYTQLVGEQLARMGHEVHVFTSSNVRRVVMHHINQVRVWECPGWSKRREMPLWNALEFSVRHKAEGFLLQRYSFAVAVRLATRERKFDLIESPESGALGGLVMEEGLARRLAVRIHCVIYDVRQYQKEKQNYAWDCCQEISREITLRADALTAPTEYARQSVAEYWQVPLERTKIIGNPIARTSWHERPKERNDGRAIFWGRLEPRKGVDTLAATIGLVRHKFPNFKVTFVGAEGYWPEGRTTRQVLRENAAKFGGEGGYEILPPMGHDKLVSLARRAGVAVLPSRAETFGLSFLEAMMWGVPTVAADIPPFRELAEEEKHCLFADPNRPEELAKAICRVLAEQSMAERMAADAYQQAQHWTVERIVPQLIEAWMN